MDTSCRNRCRYGYYCTNLPKLVHRYTSLFLLLDRFENLYVKCISNSLIHNLQGERALYIFCLVFNFFDDGDTAVAKVSVSST